jgi:hypothetical protein
MFRALWSRLTRKSVSRPVTAAAGPLLRAPMAPDWEPEHQRELNSFLRSGTGVVLMERMRAVEANTAARACKEPYHIEHSAGIALGFNQARDWIESLSRVARDPATSAPEDSSPEHHTLSIGESELRERLSP